MQHKTYMEALNLYHSVLPYRLNRQKVRGYQNKISTTTPTRDLSLLSPVPPTLTPIKGSHHANPHTA